MEIKVDTDLVLQLQEYLENGTSPSDAKASAMMASMSAADVATVKKLLTAIEPFCFCNAPPKQR